MSTLTVRTKDEELLKALQCWWEEFSPGLPEGKWILTDGDTEKVLGKENEIVFSETPGKGQLVRPFSFEELEGLFGESGKSAAPEREGARRQGQRLIFSGERAILDGQPLLLTPLEGRLLKALLDAERPLSSSELSERLFGTVRPSNQVSVYIGYLRKKTDLPGKERLIFTAHGRGYYLKNE